MANTFEHIAIKDIEENVLNSERSMNAGEIQNLMNSIIEVGLIHPLTVYENAGKYILVSGHKRLKALKMLGRTGTVPCVVIAKPANETEEAETLARANVYRNDPDALKKEIKIINTVWNTMDFERRNRLKDKYKAAFEEANKNVPEYMEDPKKFLDTRFRARIEYIKDIGGITTSNKTIQRALHDIAAEEMEQIDDEPKEKKEKTITIKSVRKAIDSLKGLCDGYMKAHEMSEYELVLLTLRDSLGDAAEDLKDAEEEQREA